MDEQKSKERKVLQARGDYALVACKGDNGQLLYGLTENGKLIATEEDEADFYQQVGFVSSSWELWLSTERIANEPWPCAYCKQVRRLGDLINDPPDGYCTERWVCRECYGKSDET